MSVQAARDALELVFASKPYRDWAAVPGYRLDAEKVASEFNGTRRGPAGSLYAKGLIDLCRLNPPSGPSPPDPASPLDAVWRGDALYVNAVSSFDGPRRNAAFAAGFRTVYAQLLHIADPERQRSNEEHLGILRAEHFAVGGWGTYGQDDADPAQDARDAAAIVRRLGLRCWKANGEAWAEWEHSWKTKAFLDAWNAEGAPCPLGWSVLSSDTANFGRAYDYVTALLAPGADIDIQVYGATVPTYTVAAGLGMLRNTVVPGNRTTMTFDITERGTGPFGDYRTWPGPRRLWVGEWSTADTYRQLAR